MNRNTEMILGNCWIELAARWILGITFIYASYHKVVSPAGFAKIVYGYGLFPDVIINLIAIILPFVELFSGLALILGIYPRSAALIINSMLLAFIIALSINIIRGREFDCGCFSENDLVDAASSKQVVFRDIIYFVLGIHVLFFNRLRKWCIHESGSIGENLLDSKQFE